MRRLLWVFLLLFLFVGCALEPVTEPRSINFENEPTPLPLPESAEKTTYIVERGTIQEQLKLQGRVGSNSSSTLTADREGRVTAILVQEGSTLIEGDEIALLDTSAIDEQLALIQLELATAEEKLSILQAELSAETRAANLALERATLALASAQTAGATADEIRLFEIDVELAEITVDELEIVPDPVLQLEIANLRGQIDTLEAQRANQRLTASHDGDLVGLNLQVGSRVNEGQTIGTVVNLDELMAWAEATSGDLAQLAEGTPVQFVLPSNTEEIFVGEIDRLPIPAGRGTLRENTVQVVSDDLPAYSERVDIAITLAEKADALWIPPAALREFAGQPFVIVLDGDDERRIEVEVGITSIGRVEIVEGLSEGEVIVAP